MPKKKKQLDNQTEAKPTHQTPNDPPSDPADELIVKLTGQLLHEALLLAHGKKTNIKDLCELAIRIEFATT